MIAERSRVWITGMGLVTPLGSDPESFWSSLIEGRSGAAAVRSFDTSALPNHVGCEVRDLRVPAHLRTHILGGRCCELAAVAADQAIREAGIEDRVLGTSDFAVVVGTTMGDVLRFEQERALHPDEPARTRTSMRWRAGRSRVMAATIARMHRVRGPVVTVPAACAAGNYAIGLAASLIARGEAKAAIAIGCEAFSRLAFVGFSRMRAMSTETCRPFSRNRPGLLLGEGAAALVLESEASARERGAEARGRRRRLRAVLRRLPHHRPAAGRSGRRRGDDACAVGGAPRAGRHRLRERPRDRDVLERQDGERGGPDGIRRWEPAACPSRRSRR